MSVVIGIDLGTTNSAIAVVEDGIPFVLANEAGERIMPSALYTHSEADFKIGSPAKRAGSLNPKNLITSTKRLIGQTSTTIGTDQNLSNLTVEGTTLFHQTEHGKFRPEEVSAEILKELKRTVEFRLGTPAEEAVITVPAYFNHNQREQTLKAAELAGFKVTRLLNEPTAAALSYGLNREKGKQTIIVYDLGGGTFDLSVLELNDGVFQVLSTAGDTQLGGDDIDQLLVDWIIEQSQLNTQTLDDLQKQRLSEAAQQAKCELSEETEVSITIPFFNAPEAENIDITLSRNEFETLITTLLKKTESLCLRALSDAELEVSDIDSVILVGGSTRIPAVRSLCEKIFKQAPNLSENPDESIAIGAAIQAGILSGAFKKVLLLDVTPLSLGIETFGGLMNVIIPRNTTIPCKAGEMFTNSITNQKTMAVRVLQGERELAKDNWQLGEFELEFQPQPKGQARIGIQFSIDENGVLEVLGRDTSDESDTLFQIEDIAVNVADSDVEQMIEDSVEHAFEDMHARRLTEAKLKSKELSSALETVFQHYGNLMTQEEETELPALLSELNQAIENDDLPALKALNKTIDQKTLGIASRITEQL